MTNYLTPNTSLKKVIDDHHKNQLIFDFDETLAWLKIDWSNWSKEIAVAAVTRKLGFDYQPATKDENFNRLVKKHGLKFAQVVDKFNQQYEAKYLRQIVPNSGLISLLKEWSKQDKYQLYLYTSNSRPTIMLALKELGLEACFSKIVTRSDVGLIKPDPEGFRLIYEPSQDKIEYLMVGNSGSDRGMAQAAGIDFYLVDYF